MNTKKTNPMKIKKVRNSREHENLHERRDLMMMHSGSDNSIDSHNFINSDLTKTSGKDWRVE